MPAPTADNKDQPSIIIVEVIGYGGGDDSPGHPNDERKNKDQRSDNQPNYDPDSAFQIIGNGQLTENQADALTPQERAQKARIEASGIP